MFRLIYNKRLLVDSSAEEFARVKANLEKANIPFYVRTVKSSPTILQGSHAAAYKRYAMSYTPQKDYVTYVYYIYVKRKDYEKAKEIGDLV